MALCLSSILPGGAFLVDGLAFFDTHFHFRAGSVAGSSAGVMGECDVSGQDILPLLEEDEEEEEEEEEEEISLKRRKLRKSHQASRYHSHRARDRSASERSSCHARRSRELPWRVDAPRQLWEPNEEEEDDSHVKRKKRRRQKSRRYQTGEYLTEREEERVGFPHRRRKSKAGMTGVGWEGISGTRPGPKAFSCIPSKG